MLSIPKNGWVSVSLVESAEVCNKNNILTKAVRNNENLCGENIVWSDRASYLTDVHFDLISAILRWFELKTPQCVSFDAEGWEYIVVFDWCRTYVIDGFEDDEEKLYSVEKGIGEMSLEIYNDINNYREDWYSWSAYSGSAEEISEHKEKLDILLKRLREVLIEEKILV